MKYLLILFSTILITACGGGVDNAEPPAELVDFTASAELSVNKEIEYNATASRYARVHPLELDENIIFAESAGSITVFSKKTFNILWQKRFDDIQPSAIGGDNNLYLLGTRSGELVAINPENGERIWKARVSSEVLAKPVVKSGIVVVKTVDGQLTALDATSGKEKWIFKKDVPALSVRGNSTPVIVDKKIITGLDSGKLVIVDLMTGQLFWEKTITIPRGRSETERLVDLDADLIINENVLYIAGFQGRVVALDLKSGDFLWVRKMSVIHNMTFEDGRIYITDVRSHIWALDSVTGATIWKQGVFTARKFTSASVMDDYLLFGDYQGYIHVLAKADGHQVARLQVDEAGFDIPPVIIGETIYVQSRNSRIFLLALKKLVDR